MHHENRICNILTRIDLYKREFSPRERSTIKYLNRKCLSTQKCKQITLFVINGMTVIFKC